MCHFRCDRNCSVANLPFESGPAVRRIFARPAFSFKLLTVNAEIIAVGSEMLTPYRMDTNSLYLTEQLNLLGVDVIFKSIVGDNLADWSAAAQHGLFRSDIVIFSGGLGPTEDDLTREAVAEALGVKLHRDPEVLARLEQRFAERGWKMAPNNAKQADVLEGATVLPNPNGTAPGQWLSRTIRRTRTHHRAAARPSIRTERHCSRAKCANACAPRFLPHISSSAH